MDEKALPATAAGPSEEEIARVLDASAWQALDHARTTGLPVFIEASSRFVAASLSDARAVLALFAPILAEKSLHHESGERITRKDLNNAYRQGSENGRLAAHLIDGINSPLNACCYRDECRKLEARALAAEAALAGERERAARIVLDWQKQLVRGEMIDWHAERIAAAIRAQGE